MDKVSSKKAVYPWLSIKNVPRKIHSTSSGSLEGQLLVKDMDYINEEWSLPMQFGLENYAFTLVDIDDPRYAPECQEMTQKLIHLYSDRQIIGLEWRKTYRGLQDAENRRAKLPESAPAKTRESMDTEVTQKRTRILELQDQRDAYDRAVSKVISRCSQIKKSLQKEEQLERLRVEMTNQVKSRLDSVCATTFNPKSVKKPVASQ